MKLIRQHISKLQELCERHYVSEMYVFGSIINNKELKPDSDIDFLVKFSGVELKDYFDNYMDLKESLEFLFSRPVDLLEIQTIKNPILKRSINRNKKKIYGRENPKMAV